MDSNLVKITALCLVFGTGITIPVTIAWLEHRTRKRGLDTLRLYAERGEEPPTSVIDAVTKVTNVWGNQPHSWSNVPSVRPPQTRANHLAHAAASAIIAIGLAGLVWWRVSAYDEKGAWTIVGSLIALFFAGSVAARLVYAYYASDK